MAGMLVGRGVFRENPGTEVVSYNRGAAEGSGQCQVSVTEEVVSGGSEGVGNSPWTQGRWLDVRQYYVVSRSRCGVNNQSDGHAINRCRDAGMVASQTTIKSQISGPSEALSINTVLCVLRLRPASAGLA